MSTSRPFLTHSSSAHKYRQLATNSSSTRTTRLLFTMGYSSHSTLRLRTEMDWLRWIIQALHETLRAKFTPLNQALYTIADSEYWHLVWNNWTVTPGQPFNRIHVLYWRLNWRSIQYLASAHMISSLRFLLVSSEPLCDLLRLAVIY